MLPVARLMFVGGVVQPLNLPPSLRVHVRAPRWNSRRSHTLANLQSRITVSDEILRTSAVSSTLSPPKKRSSTTRLFRGSTAASAQGVVQRDQIRTALFGDQGGFVERQALRFSATFSVL